jgi:flavorubredoxin
MGWTIVFAVLAVIVMAVAWLDYGRNKEVASEVEVLNPEGTTGTALVVYHPGRSNFQRRVFSGFIEGLVSNGWRVENTTPSAQTPTELARFDLLVLGGPTYWFTPNRPIKRFLNRLGDLHGQRTVTIITGLGAGERSASIIQTQVREANGNLVKALLLYKMRPNDDDNFVDGEQNRALAVEIARHAALEIPPPVGT